MPEVKEIAVPDSSLPGVAIEGSEKWWPLEQGEAVLPEFDRFNCQTYYIEVFNRGKLPFNFTVESGAPWITVTPHQGVVETEARLQVGLDWKKVPKGTKQDSITITDGEKVRIVVRILAHNPNSPLPASFTGFVESNGFVSIESEHFTNAVSPAGWLCIPELGKTLSAMTPVPVTAVGQTPGDKIPPLEYRILFSSEGVVRVNAFLSPTLNFHNSKEGLRYAVSFDDEPAQVVSYNSDNSNRTWEQWVADNINVSTTKHVLKNPGVHVLKFWVVDPGVVLQKLVVETAGAGQSYLGPPESFRVPSE
jgi:hypothetical protein